MHPRGGCFGKSSREVTRQHSPAHDDLLCERMDGETYRHAISGAGALSEGFLLSGEKQYVSTVMI